MSDELHGFDHRMCGGCWIEQRSARLPYTEGFKQIQVCCWCSRPTSSGIILWTMWTPPHCPERPQ